MGIALRLTLGSIVVIMACSRSPAASPAAAPTAAPPASPSKAERLAAELADFMGTVVAVRSTARLVRDPSAADQWLSLAESVDPSEGPTHYTFMLVGTRDEWLEIESDATRQGECSYAFPLRNLRLRLFVSRDDVVLEPELYPDVCRDDSDEGYVDPSDEPALEVWGPRLAVVAEVRNAGRRTVYVQGCPSCAVDAHTRTVRLTKRVEDPPLYWPSGDLAGHATADIAMRAPTPDGDRICFFAHDQRLYPAKASLRLCVDRRFVHTRDTRQQWPDARPQILERRTGEQVPLEFPLPLAQPYPAVDAELRRRREAIFACVGPNRRGIHLSLSVDADCTALPSVRAFDDELDACLHEAYNDPPWPTVEARTSIDFVPERLADAP